MAIAEARIARRSSKPPRASAASAVTSVTMPIEAVRGKPSTAPCRKTPRNDSTVATTQVTSSMRSTGMPRSSARSPRSAAARTAIPMSLRRRNHEIANRQATDTTAATTSSLWNTCWPTENEVCQGNP